MRKLFTLLTVALASASAWAQFDDAPELTKSTSFVADGVTEYILSVKNSEGTEYFYGKGNDWGTRTSVKETADAALTVRFAPIEQTVNGETVACFKFNNYVSDKGGWNAMVDCDGGLAAWVDGQGRAGDGKWQIKDLGNGQIELTNLQAPNGKFGASWTGQYWSADEEAYIDATCNADEMLDFDNRCYFIGARVDTAYTVDDITGDTIDAKPIHIFGTDYCTTWQLYNASLYNAQKKLFDWFWESGYEYVDNDVTSVVDAIKAADEIYKNPAATAAQLNAAYDAIQDAIAMIAVNENRELLEFATPEDPIDLFAYGLLDNGDFGGDRSQSGDLTGWNAGLLGGDNHRQGDEYTNGNVKISGFAESWTWNASHGSGYGEFSRQIGLPAGLYILGVDMIATQQSTNKEKSTGVELFAKSTNGQEFFTPVATENNKPEHFEVAFVAKDGNFTIGVRENNTTCNWIAMDNWTLTYYGQTEMSLEQINLGNTIKDIEARHDAKGDIVALLSTIEAYDEAHEAAVEAYENGGLEDVSQYTVFGDSLVAKYNALSTSINDYKYFAQCIETVQGRVDEFAESNPNLSADIADYLAEIEEAYASMTWTRAQIDEILPTVSDIMGKYADVQPGDDVTFYLNNPKFTSNFSGWNVVGATPAFLKNHGQGVNANQDLCQEIPEEEDGLAECYHALFDMSQTIKNLPAGLYTLSVQGFDRHDDGEMESAQLYATFADGSEQTVDIADIEEYKTEDRLYLVVNDAGETQWQSDAGRDNDTYWVPNGMSGAAWHFVNKKDGVNYDYTNKFSILMKEAGDLKVGIRVKNTHQWVIWDNFTLIYEGSGANVWVTTIEDEIMKLEDRYNAAGITSGEMDAIDEVIEEAQALIKGIENATEEDCQNMLAKLQAQYNEIKTNTELTAVIDGYYDAVLNAAELAAEADAELQARYNAIDLLVNGDYDDLNNEELKKAIEEIKNVLTLVKLPADWNTASDENPVDVSKVIANRFFNHDGSEDPEEEPAPVQNHNFTEWSGKQFGTGGGTAANCGEVWNSSAFDAYQELVGLPAGTYVLSCQGFLRHGGGSADSYAILTGEKEQEVYAYLYGTTSEGSYSTELNNIASVQLTQAELDEQGIDISAGNSTFNDKYKVAEQLMSADNFFKAGYYKNSITLKVGEDGVLRLGIKKVNAVGQDWVVVDNFSLIYLGGASTAETSGDDATAIASVETEAQKAIYTITGVRVNKALKSGLYIINGKKVLVK
mgnify:FL=1